jgi:hypothetical protein
MNRRQENAKMNTFALAIACALGAWGCDLSQHCDPGQLYKDNACFDVRDAGAGDPDGSSADVAGGDDGAASCSAYKGFGDACTVVSQCSCGLDSCNTFMNSNYCTHSHCLANPSICPAGWTCMDVSAFDPATGSICLRP